MTQLSPHYFSTACHHGLHERCREVCKFCDELCVCACHSNHDDREPSDG